MTYALIIAEKPEHGWPESMFHALNKTAHPAGVERLNEGAWLIHVDSSLLFQARIVAILHDAGVVHHVAFFDTKPAFVSFHYQEE